jgi:hypothetical protein
LTSTFERDDCKKYVQATPTPEQLIDLYKVAIEEYRFQVKLNNDRLLHLTVFNIAILSAGAGLLKVSGSRVGNALVAAIFIAGLCTSLIGMRSVQTLHRYYRRTVYKKTVYEELLGLTQRVDLPNGGTADLSIGTTDSHGDRNAILTQTEEWVRRPVGFGSVVGGFRLTLIILAVMHALGALAAIALALHPAWTP